MAGGPRWRGEVVLRGGLALLLCALHVQAACQDATVTQELLKEGFHRDLLVKVELGVVGEETEGCAVAARIRLPPGICVDPDELALLQQQNLTKLDQHRLMQGFFVLCAADISTHGRAGWGAPAALLHPRAALPMHGRYHRPAEESEEALVVLKSPEVLVCCCDDHLSAECRKPAEVEAPCSGGNVGPCQWYSIMHKPANEELILQVPVGLRQHSSFVCAVTLLATVLCSSLILAAVCKYGHFSPVTCLE